MEMDNVPLYRLEEEHKEKEDWKVGFLCPNIVAGLCCMITCPITFFCSFKTVNVGEELVISNLGKYYGRLQNPGCFCINPCCTDYQVVSTRRNQVHLLRNTVADKNGNPLEISGIVTYMIEDTRRAALDVTDSNSFIKLQATAVLKVVASQYPYESTDHSPSLKTEAAKIKEEMKTELQHKIRVTGATVLSFELTDLSYAAEIAQNMLARQQAEATVSARDTIVKGAVSITEGAIQGLEASGVQLTREEKAQLMGNMLVMLCADSKQ
jgi:regulator of protease activity HflC (stomatin/prohibitin superfamily)